MKKIIVSIIIACIISSGCKRDRIPESIKPEDPAPVNSHPVARAGNDTSIMLPANKGLLNGSGSYDPDNNIASYHWSKLSGPRSFNIANPNSAITEVTNLVKGNYEFLLKVTDSLAKESLDIIRVSVDTTLPPPPPVTGYNVYIRPHDTALTLPENSVSLRAETWSWTNQPILPAIREILWTKVVGPDNYVFQSPNTLTTSVNNLTDGMYLFNCKVTDTSGISRSGYGAVVNVTDSLTSSRKLVILNQNWDAHLGEPFVEIELSNYIPAGKSIKKVYIKRDCDTVFHRAPYQYQWSSDSPFIYVLGWRNNTFVLWVYMVRSELWCSGDNDTPDIKIIY